MKHSIAALSLVGTGLLLSAVPSQATLTTFTGTGTASAFGPAATAKAAFLAQTTGSSVLTFDRGIAEAPIQVSSSSPGTSVPFTGGPSADLLNIDGDQYIISDSFVPDVLKNQGRFNTTGHTVAYNDGTSTDGGILESTGSFIITFTEAVKAFGFFGTDIGDFGGSLDIELCNTTCTPLSVVSGALSADPTLADSSLVFWGFVDTGPGYTSIKFNHTNTTIQGLPLVDGFGYDDFVVAGLRDLPPDGNVPEPSVLALIGAGLIGAMFGRRRQRSR